MGKRWAVGCPHQGKESFVKRELENQGFENYLPLCISGSWSSRPRIKAFLPGYIFIRIDADNERWRAIFSTYGMRTVLHSGERPQWVSDWIIDGIKEREVDGLVRLPPRIQCKFKKGDMVTMKGHPLQLIFDEPLDHRRAMVFMSFLGRQHRQPVQLSRLAPAPFVAPA